MLGTSTYSLEEFGEAYELSAIEAQKIMKVFGSNRADLNAFMLVFRNRGIAESLFISVAARVSR